LERQLPAVHLSEDLERQTRHRRSGPAFGLATLALVACAKTPDPPGECNLIQVTVDWAQFHPIPRQINLDSLRSLVAGTEDDGTRAHLVQEYVFAANRLDRRTRQAALASVAKVLK
jgi:hypothetical protein